jgi:hypothetical protein
VYLLGEYFFTGARPHTAVGYRGTENTTLGTIDVI